MGKERAVRKLGQSKGIPRATAESWSVKFSWQDRVSQYELELAKSEYELEEKALKEEAAFFAKEIISHRRQALADAAELRKVALSKLKRLQKATLGDICRALQTANSMKRLELNMATEKTEVSGPDNVPLTIQQAAPVVIVLEQNDRDTPKS